MTRIDSVRDAAERTRDSVRHAADVVAPYADTAKVNAVHYADEARIYLAPRVSAAGRQARAAARTQYDAHLAARLDQALAAVPPGVQQKVGTAARRTRDTARLAAEFTAPRMGQAVTTVRSVAAPAAEEAAARSAAAVAVLRSHVTADDIRKLERRRERRARNGQIAKGLLLAGLVAGAGFAAWKWWSKQTNPDWLVEPAPATEVADRASLNGGVEADASFGKVDGSPVDALDPEVQAKQAESDADDRRDRGDTYP
ncbi:DUF5324 family protein [Actinacidiphila glaucinigra]|uniref:DUF5324 family protein n=1 Tax=Actinacidiphila glaucinigra TaxID=235986 RepID=UPI00386AE6EC